jgi:tRNA (cmo5U34)-methyltransferase
MESSSDRLYQVDTVPEDFDFNKRVVEVFDDMLDRSIPFYQEVISATAWLLENHLEPGDRVCDLGCATGTSMLKLSELLKGKELVLEGLDSSGPMLEKARLKAEFYGGRKEISFSREDITAIERPGTGAFIMNYTMQFIRPLLRPPLVKRLYDNLRPGGLLILSEKTIQPDKLLNRNFIDIYHRYKRERGYSELEIARKREALENILIPFSGEENRAMLLEAGFSPVMPFLQWFNFSSLVAIKPT